ncbi:hypothetical protein PV-S19_0051 [Pacmanvirus S19]|nr:hypothetical protein PV-S19_0051 [Pacmanvirus S19]
MNIKSSDINGMRVDELIKHLQYVKFMYGDIIITHSSYIYDDVVYKPIFNIRKAKAAAYQDFDIIYKENQENEKCNSNDIIILE